MTDFRLGLRYGIPLCCVLFYVLIWRHLDAGYNWYFRRFVLADRDYIPCPLCALLGTGRGKEHKMKVEL